MHLGEPRPHFSADNLQSMSGTWIPGDLGDETKLVHAGVAPDKETGAILTPIHQVCSWTGEGGDDSIVELQTW